MGTSDKNIRLGVIEKQVEELVKIIHARQNSNYKQSNIEERIADLVIRINNGDIIDFLDHEDTDAFLEFFLKLRAKEMEQEFQANKWEILIWRRKKS